MYKTMNINTQDDLYILCTIYPGFFPHITKFAKMGKCLNSLFASGFFLRFLKFLKANNTGKTFCVLKNLLITKKKKKIDHHENHKIYRT